MFIVHVWNIFSRLIFFCREKKKSTYVPEIEWIVLFLRVGDFPRKSYDFSCVFKKIDFYTYFLKSEQLLQLDASHICLPEMT